MGGGRNLLLERGDKPEKEGRRVDVTIGGLSLFLLLFSSMTFTVCGGK